MRIEPLRDRPRPAMRVMAGFLSAYVFVWGLMSLGTVAALYVGLSYHDAEQLCVVVGLLALIVLFLWTFASHRPWRAWMVLSAGGLVLTWLAIMLEGAVMPAVEL